MNNLSQYIREKLIIDKDIAISKYIIYYKSRATEQYKEHIVVDKLDELKELRKDILKDKYYRIFKCKTSLVDEFIHKWDNFNPLPTVDDEESFWDWFEKNGMKELKAEDVNNYFYGNKK